MRKRPEIVALILFAVLVFYGTGLNMFIVPVMQNMLATVSAPLSWPTRVYAIVNANALGELLLFIALVAFALSRAKPKDDPVQQARVLNFASLVVTVFLALQAGIFFDLAVSATKIVNQNSRRIASVAQAIVTQPVR